MIREKKINVEILDSIEKNYSFTQIFPS